MANNGYKQATVAYKTDRDGNPVDINGQLTSVSGRRQAIAVLQGRANPNPSIYEIEFYYNENALINGTPSITYDPVACPYGYISVTPTSLIFEAGITSGVAVLESSNTWREVSVPSGFSVDTQQGGGGVYNIGVRAISPRLPANYTSGAITKTGYAISNAQGYRRTSATNSTMFKVQPGKSHFYTGQITDASYAGVVFQDQDHNFLGFACGDVRTYDREPLVLPAGTFYIAACSFGGDPVIETTPVPASGEIVFINEITGETVELYVAYVLARPWVLDNGTWNDLGFWYNNGIFNF